MKAFGSVMRAVGSAQRAFGRVMRALGRDKKTFISVIRALTIMNNISHLYQIQVHISSDSTYNNKLAVQP